MNSVILGGNAAANQSWNDGMAEIMRPISDFVQQITYDHWTQETPLIDINIEAKKLQEICNTSETGVIIAKSAGTLVALMAIHELGLRPRACIFAGVPIDWAEEYGFALSKWLDGHATPTLFIQQQHDPLGSCKQLEELICESRVSQHEVRCIPGDDHAYENFSEIGQLIRAYLT